MKITYQTVDFESQSIDLENVVNLRINGIQIKEEKDGLRLSVDDKIEVNPNASNSVSIRQKTKK